MKSSVGLWIATVVLALTLQSHAVLGKSLEVNFHPFLLIFPLTLLYPELTVAHY